MEIKEIIKNLEKLKNNKDRLKYLEKIAKEAKGKDKEIIEKIIKELKTLEDKIEEIPIARREIAEEIETPIYIKAENTRTNEIITAKKPEEETQKGYSIRNYGINTLSYDTTAWQDIGNISERAREKLLMESDISEISFSIDLGRDTLREKIRNMSPGINEEQIIMYVNQFTSKETKYIKRLR